MSRCLSGSLSVRFPLGVLTWTSWAAPGSVGTAGKVVLPHNPVTWRPSAAVQARELRSSAERGVRGHDKCWRTQKGWRLMKYRLVMSLLVVVGLVVALFSATAAKTTQPALAADGDIVVDGCPATSVAKKPPCDGDNAILRWDEQLLSTIRAYPRKTGPTITARALGVLHTATYDAWAAYDPIAKGTNPNGKGPAQQDKALITEANKKEAISYAAYRVLVDLFPPVAGKFPPVGAYQDPAILLQSINNPAYDPNNTTLASITDTKASPAGVGNLAAQAVIDFRRGDRSNQVNDYADTTGYNPKNQWNSVTEEWKWRWQPLCVPLSSASATGCGGTIQAPLTPQWGQVITFSGLGPTQFQSMAPGPPRTSGTTGYSDAEVATALTDTDLSSPTDGELKKAKAEYWADGPGTEFPPGHTAIFAQALSRKKRHSLDTDAKMFFMVGNTMMDASIASWWLKYKYDFWRPITAIRYLYKDKDVWSWRGPGANPSTGNFGWVKGQNWMPYQATGVVTPNFPEYVSGHSTFTAGGASILSMFNGSDTFGAKVIIPKNSLNIELKTTPTQDVELSWATFSEASNEAGWSRRYGGIHFYSGDIHGRGAGRQVASSVYSKAQNYIKGYIGK